MLINDTGHRGVPPLDIVHNLPKLNTAYSHTHTTSNDNVLLTCRFMNPKLLAALYVLCVTSFLRRGLSVGLNSVAGSVLVASLPHPNLSDPRQAALRDGTGHVDGT